MLRNILTFSFRNFFRNFNYSLITLSGLVIGIATAVLVFIWVSFELSYDRQDPDAQRVFTVLIHELWDGSIETNESTNVPLADFLLHDVPEVETMTRVDNDLELLSYNQTSVAKRGNYADSTYFSVFPTEIIAGLPTQPLDGKSAIAISQELA